MNPTHRICGWCWLQQCAALIPLLILWFTASVVPADVVWLKQETEPQYGIIVRFEDGLLVFDKRQARGTYKRMTWSREEILEYHKSVDLERLEQLHASGWTAYRDYAEELAEQSVDPESRDLAVQLYLIAAFHGDRSLRTSALRGLIAVGRNTQEVAMFRRLLLLEASAGDPPQRQPQPRPLAGEAETPEGRQNLLTAVQKLRQGETAGVNDLIEDESTRRALRAYASEDLTGRLKQIANVNRPSLSQLKLLVEIESALRFQFQSQSEKRMAANTDWSAAFEQPPSIWVGLSRLETATEFDVYKTIFRDGRWRKPDQFGAGF